MCDINKLSYTSKKWSSHICDSDKCPVYIKKYNELFNLISLTGIFILVSRIFFWSKLVKLSKFFTLEIRTKNQLFRFRRSLFLGIVLVSLLVQTNQ